MPRSQTVKYFYPRPPRGGRRGAGQSGPMLLSISIHALREEGDPAFQPSMPLALSFLSTPSARRATVRVTVKLSLASNFYPRPPRGGRQILQVRMAYTTVNFYPRPPRGGRRRGAGQLPAGERNFYPRPPRGGRRGADVPAPGFLPISIHALREEGDPRRWWRSERRVGFLSTPSAKRATEFSKIIFVYCEISIHALREEGDQHYQPTAAGGYNFYPRPPRGGRPAPLVRSAQLGYFYPRPPRGGRPAAGCTR